MGKFLFIRELSFIFVTKVIKMENDLFKARHGRYEDNAKNRRLHRVGQEYGDKKAEDEDKADGNAAEEQLAAINRAIQQIASGKVKITQDKANEILNKKRELEAKVREEKLSKMSPKEVNKEIAALGQVLAGRLKDGRDTKEIEQQIAGALKYATDEQIQNTLESFKTNFKKTPVTEIAAKLTQAEADRRKAPKEEKPVEKPETKKEEPKKEEPAKEETETYTRVKFEDMPNSSKVNLKKYLSTKIRNNVDKTWKDIAKMGDKTLQDMNKNMTQAFNEKFDDMSKSQRAEALYSIMKVRGEMAKRGGEPKTEEKPGDKPAPKQEPAKEEPKVDYKIPESFKELYVQTRYAWAQIMETKPREIDYTNPKEVAEMAAEFFPGTTVNKTDDQEEYFVQYPGVPNKYMRIDKYVKSPAELANKIKLFLGMGIAMPVRIQFSVSDMERLDMLNTLMAESVADKAKPKDIGIARAKAFKEQIAVNNKEIELHSGYKQGKPMSFEEANEGKGNPKYVRGVKDEYHVNCQSCVVVHELRLRGFNIGARGKVTQEQKEMSLDMTYAWVDPLTGLQPDPILITSAVNNKNTRVRKSGKSRKQLYQNINAATKEPARYNFSYGWEDGRDHSGHIITMERHPDGKLTIYDPQDGEKMPMEKLLNQVSPKYLCKLIRVDNLLVKPDIVNKFAKKYE